MKTQKNLKEHLPEHLAQIRGVVAKIARDDDLIDDISQECCIRIIEKENLWDGNEGKVKQWINRVTRNFTINFLKKHRRERSRYQETEMESIQVPSSHQLNEDHIRWIMEQLKTLPEMQRKVIHLKYFEGMNSTEIANELGISQQTVFTHLNRALRAFQKRARAQEMLMLLFPWNWDWEKLSTSFTSTFLVNPYKFILSASLKIKLALALSLSVTGIYVVGDVDFLDKNEKNYAEGNLFWKESNLNVSEKKSHKEVAATTELFKPTKKLTRNSIKSNSAPAKDVQVEVFQNIEKTYYVSGELKTETPLLEGVIHGKKIMYYKNGKKSSEIHYVQGKQEGVQKTYYNTGHLKFEWPHHDDKANGLKKVYYDSGQLLSELFFKDGLEQGISKSYYETGSLKNEIEFLEGLFNGVSRAYDEEGKIITEEVYFRGKRHGNCQSFFPSGEIKSTTKYENGQLIGESISYYESGNIKSVYPYKYGIVHGKQMEFYPSGKIKKESIYVEGQLQGPQWTYDKNGDIEEK